MGDRMHVSSLITMMVCFLLIFAKLEPVSLDQQSLLVNKYFKKIELTEPNSLIDFIDCIYVINLDTRRDRWTWMESLCKKQSLTPNRVSAVDGWALSEEAKQEMTAPYPCRLRGGQFGCLLSHLSVLRDAYQRNFEVIWVMEDDVEFVEDPRQLSDLLAKLSLWDPDWDIFFTDTDFRDDHNGYLQSLSLIFGQIRIINPFAITLNDLI